MEPESNQNRPDHTYDDLQRLVDALSIDQIRFVVARQNESTDKEAAHHIHVSPATVKGWKTEGAPIDEAVKAMATDGLVVATQVRRRNLAKAMLVKVAGLDSDDEKVRQTTATEIIEWELGKAAQVNKNEHKGEVAITIHHVPRRYTEEAGGDSLLAAPEASGVSR